MVIATARHTRSITVAFTMTIFKTAHTQIKLFNHITPLWNRQIFELEALPNNVPHPVAVEASGSVFVSRRISCKRRYTPNVIVLYSAVIICIELAVLGTEFICTFFDKRSEILERGFAATIEYLARPFDPVHLKATWESLHNRFECSCCIKITGKV